MTSGMTRSDIITIQCYSIKLCRFGQMVEHHQWHDVTNFQASRKWWCCSTSDIITSPVRAHHSSLSHWLPASFWQPCLLTIASFKGFMWCLNADILADLSLSSKTAENRKWNSNYEGKPGFQWLSVRWTLVSQTNLGFMWCLNGECLLFLPFFCLLLLFLSAI